MADVMERTEMDMMEELPFPGAEPVQEAVKQAEEVAQEAEKAERAEISIAFAKGLCSDPFTAKDGKEYVQIKIPEEGGGIWPTFVLPANHVHENQHGKGLWAKIPEDGTTKVRRTQITAESEDGRKLYSHQDEKVPNKTLKAMVEAYKEKTKEAEQKSSIMKELSEPMIKVTAATPTVKPPVVGGDAR